MRYALAAALVLWMPLTAHAGSSWHGGSCGNIADDSARRVCYAKSARDPDSDSNEDRPTRIGHTIGDKVTLSDASIGCGDLDDLSKVRELAAVMKDEVAALRAARRAGCPTKQAGDSGTVQDTSLWHAALCVHFSGEPDCLWIPRKAFD